MDTAALRRFAQAARRQLREQVGAKLGLVLALGWIEEFIDAIQSRDFKRGVAQR